MLYLRLIIYKATWVLHWPWKSKTHFMSASSVRWWILFRVEHFFLVSICKLKRIPNIFFIMFYHRDIIRRNIIINIYYISMVFIPWYYAQIRNSLTFNVTFVSNYSRNKNLVQVFMKSLKKSYLLPSVRSPNDREHEIPKTKKVTLEFLKHVLSLKSKSEFVNH